MTQENIFQLKGISHKEQTVKTLTEISDTLRADFTSKLDAPFLLGVLVELIPFLVACFKPKDAEQTQEYLSKKYRTGGRHQGTFRRKVLNGAEAQVLKAAEKEGKTLTDEEASMLAHQSLYKTMTMPSHELELLLEENR